MNVGDLIEALGRYPQEYDVIDSDGRPIHVISTEDTEDGGVVVLE